MNLIWDFDKQEWIMLRPYMRWVPKYSTRTFTEDQWEAALRLSVTDSEYAAILEGRRRSGR